MKATWAERFADIGERFVLPVTDQVGNEALRRNAIRVCEQWGGPESNEAIRLLRDCEFRFELIPFDWGGFRRSTRAIELVIMASEESVRVLQDGANRASRMVISSLLATVQVFDRERVIARPSAAEQVGGGGRRR